VNECNERIVHHGLSVICACAANDHDDDSSDGGGRADSKSVTSFLAGAVNMG